MKLLSIAIVAFLLICISAQAETPGRQFSVRSYGNFKKILDTKTTEGVVVLDTILSAPHTYAVGEIKHAEGEITVYNSEVWLNYGDDGINASTNEIPKGEEAMQLITARVEHWQDIPLPKNMSEDELHSFVIDQARKMGLNVKVLFPFLVEGEVTGLVWHVMRDADVGQNKELFFTKLVEYREHASAILVGFCSEGQNGFYLPGEIWHMHVLFKKEKTAGHLDACSFAKGARLRLPVK